MDGHFRRLNGDDARPERRRRVIPDPPATSVLPGRDAPELHISMRLESDPVVRLTATTYEDEQRFLLALSPGRAAAAIRDALELLCGGAS